MANGSSAIAHEKKKMYKKKWETRSTARYVCAVRVMRPYNMTYVQGKMTGKKESEKNAEKAQENQKKSESHVYI